jgi:hypothetical protein
MTRTARMVDTLAKALPNRISRRGFFAGSAVVGSALALDPVNYLIKPGSAYAAVCNCHGSSCACGSACCDGYTEFCCTLTGANSCPPGSLLAGWWKADGTQFCGGPRYYMDCNSDCGGCGCGSSGVCSGSCSGTVCGCGNGDCNNRAAGCNEFRYGQCHQEIPCIGPIVCRVVTCVPPWAIDATCTTTTRIDQATGQHDRDCLHAVIGAFDSATEAAGGIRVTGWALDFDTQASLAIHAYVDGALVAAAGAGLARPDVAAVYPGYGTAHGFDFVAPASPGKAHTVCVYGINAGYQAGGNPLLGCRTVTPHGPFGNIELYDTKPTSLRVAGWVVDPDATTSLTLQVLVDDVVAGQMVASGSRPDVATVYPSAGPAHGFDLTVPMTPGSHNVCVKAINVGPGIDTLLDCRKIEIGVPFGVIEVIEPALPGIRVAGWVIDPDTTAPIDVAILVDGTVVKTVTARAVRTDVGAVYPSSGSAHGFDTTIASTPGNHEVKVRALNDGVGPDPDLAMRTVAVPTGNPFGIVDFMNAGPDLIEVIGWVIDPDTKASVTIRVDVDGATAGSAVANLSRPDVAAAYAGYGSAHGFRFTVPAASGLRNVCVTAVNLLGGTDARLLCRSVFVGGAPFGSLDLVHAVPGGIRVAGWAIDPDTAAPVGLSISVDGSAVANTSAGNPRPDLQAFFPLYGANHGFDVTVPATGGSHTVCVTAIDTLSGSGNTVLACKATQVPTGNPFGVVDVFEAGAGSVHMAGWAIDPDTAGPITIEVRVDGVVAGTTSASLFRPDVGAIYTDYGSNHGYQVTVPAASGTRQVCVYAVNTGGGTSNALLRCATVVVP